jgi:hypothetical protein
MIGKPWATIGSNFPQGRLGRVKLVGPLSDHSRQISGTGRSRRCPGVLICSWNEVREHKVSRKKVKKRAANRKPTAKSLVFKFDEPKVIPSYQVTADGQVRLLDMGSRVAAPSSTFLMTSYARPKGDKVITRMPLANDKPSIHAEGALRRYKNLFVIDTNTVVLRGVTVSVACLGIADFCDDPEGNTTLRFAPVWVIEFHNCVDKQENLAWSILQSIILSSPDYSLEDRYAIVTDSDLGKHVAYNERSAPIFGSTFLAPNIDLLYASADVTRGVLNHLIKWCDREASAFITALERGERAEEAHPVLNGPCSHFRAVAFRINMVPRNWIRPGKNLPFSMA